MKESLDRAVRDNDLVYVSPIPPASQLAPVVGAAMVKVVSPKEVSDPIGWLMGGGAGMPALFSGLVPYGVHLALSESYILCRRGRAENKAYTTIARILSYASWMESERSSMGSRHRLSSLSICQARYKLSNDLRDFRLLC